MTESARDAITELFEQWLARVAGGDREFFGRVLDESWLYVDIFGAVRDKATYLDYLENEVPPGVEGELLEMDCSTYGDVAIATGLYVIRGSLVDGTDVSSQSRFTAVWRRDGEGWRALVHHATTVV